MPKIVRKIDALRKEIAAARTRGRTIGLVPTMGALHEGHLELVRAARRACDVVVVSIFVNPTQFGPGEDFARYPRDLARDRSLLAAAGCDVIFVPSIEEMYPGDFRTRVWVDGMGEILCGETRPGHFAGVTLVVLKLLLVVMPDAAFFGEKDYQQLVIIKRMVEDLAFPARIVSVATVRDKDGLALSSRNAYLSTGDRAAATSLYRSLELAKLLVAAGESRSERIIGKMTSLLLNAGATAVDYVAVVDPETLEPVARIKGEVRVLVAARVGATRLIDNVSVDPSLLEGSRPIKGDLVCVVLAAGEGKRMRSGLPKVLHRVGGRPMLEHVVAACKKAGAAKILAVVGHGSEQVKRVLAPFGVETVTQEVQRGTGHAVLQAFPLLRNFGGDLLVVSGDTPLVGAGMMRRLVAAHAAHRNVITFATACVADPRGYGRIVRDGRGAFLKIVEERDADARTRRIKEVNAGLYCFKAPVLFDSLLLSRADNSQMEYYLTGAIDAVRSAGGRVEALLSEDAAELAGVNTPDELEAVRREYAKRARGRRRS